MQKRGAKWNSKRKAIHIAILEVKNQKRQRFFEALFLFIALFSTSLLLILFSAHFLMTGYASYIEGRSGDIMSLEITRKFPSIYWGGVYGLALRVPDFTEQLFMDLGNEIKRQDVFFDCLLSTAPGGPEVFASTSPTVNFDSLAPATPQMIDNFIGCSGKVDCASNTFTDTMNITLGTSNTILGIPSTHTYNWEGDTGIFDIGILNDSQNLVFVAHPANVQRSYNYEKIVNFQMLLPIPYNTTQTYYFFNDPYDECPAGGGIGNTIDANIWGFARDTNNNTLPNVSVNLAGTESLTDSTGFYNLSVEIIEGTFNLVATKQGYDDYFSNVTISFSNYSFEKNITMNLYTPYYNQTIRPVVDGYVFDSSGSVVSGVNVSLGGATNTTNSSGYYYLNPTINPEPQAIIATKQGYNNYYSFLNFTENTTYLNHNITITEISEVSELLYETGPYTSPPHPLVQQIIQEITKNGEDYWVSTKEVNKEVRQNTFIEEMISLYSFRSGMNLVFSLSPNLEDFIKLDKTSLSVSSNSFGNVKMTIYGTRPIGEYNGTLTISGSIDQEIPITIKVVERRMPIETLLMKIDLFNRVVRPGENLKYKLSLQNLLRDQKYKIALNNMVKDQNTTTIYSQTQSQEEIDTTLTLLDEIKIPENISEGEYLLKIDAEYMSLFSSVTAVFIVAQPLYLYSFFGIPLWVILAIISFFSFIALNFFLYKRHLDKKKRYRISLDTNTLPKPGERTIKLGKIAEKNIPAYLELERLTTHTIVAGATGMGKSISAQVIIEEALMKGVCVMVFDPTAQWSGMLRKNEDKKMMSFYPKFGMKPKDARGFPGNIRQVVNERQLIDVKKYIEPGHIQIFTLNKLDPSKIDIFIANVIRQVFKSDPQESPELKVLLVFDEVHRLLAKFGGSGEGFLQIERACREFRKWGIGLILISQVLNDFVGEIKANINTEVQTRTIEESDLERIKTKYGEEFLKSLVKAEVGVAMFQNAEYNRGRPYFVNFRPILHSTRRLPDEELEKYNKYNDEVDDIAFQIEQLEKEKVDVFDLKMELKLVKDKIMTGNFSVVDIYLEGLKPRLVKQWEKIGKKPKKREIELVSQEEIDKSIKEAKDQREKLDKIEEAKKAKEEKKAPKEEEKPESHEEKQYPALTFDNGLMMSSVKELKNVLPNLDEEIFKIHVNEKKNDIAKWFEQIDKPFADKIKPIQDKNQLIKELENFGKPFEKTEILEESKQEKPEDKKEEKKSEAEQPKTEEQNNSPEKQTEGEKIVPEEIKQEKAPETKDQDKK